MLDVQDKGGQLLLSLFMILAMVGIISRQSATKIHQVTSRMHKASAGMQTVIRHYLPKLREALVTHSEWLQIV